MALRIRPGVPNDRNLLVALMEEFYAESQTPFDRDAAEQAFAELLRDDTLGRAWILERNGLYAGYLVLTIGFSMEYFGCNAFIDDLFVRKEHRGYGLGRMAMEAVLEECRMRGVRALHLEVARDNVSAKTLYRKYGFIDHHRQLMTRPMASLDTAA